MLDERFQRAMKDETASSVLPAPGKFFNPDKQGYKGEKFVEGMEDAGIEVDLELGNYISMTGKPSDVTNKTFQNLYVTARPSEKLSTFGKNNKSVARVNEYDGENLTLAQMKANYKKNTGDKNPPRVRTNLLQPEKFAVNTKQGLKRLDNPIVSVEGTGSKHFYTLDTQFVGPVRMNREGKKGNKIPQPNLRPETVGKIKLGKVVGHIFVYGGKKGYTTIDGKKGRLHPIYDYIEVDGSSALPEGITKRKKFNTGIYLQTAQEEIADAARDEYNQARRAVGVGASRMGSLTGMPQSTLVRDLNSMAMQTVDEAVNKAQTIVDALPDEAKEIVAQDAQRQVDLGKQRAAEDEAVRTGKLKKATKKAGKVFQKGTKVAKKAIASNPYIEGIQDIRAQDTFKGKAKEGAKVAIKQVPYVTEAGEILSNVREADTPRAKTKEVFKGVIGAVPQVKAGQRVLKVLKFLNDKRKERRENRN